MLEQISLKDTFARGSIKLAQYGQIDETDEKKRTPCLKLHNSTNSLLRVFYLSADTSNGNITNLIVLIAITEHEDWLKLIRGLLDEVQAIRRRSLLMGRAKWFNHLYLRGNY